MKQVLRLSLVLLFSLQTIASSSPNILRQEFITGSANFTEVDIHADLFEALANGNFYNEFNPSLKPSAKDRFEQLRQLGVQNAGPQEPQFPEVTNLPPLEPGFGTPEPDANRPVLPGLPGLPGQPGKPTTPGTRPTTPQTTARVLEGFLGRDVTVAKVSEEFKCDLFGNNPYKEIDASLTALIDAMKIQPECKDSVNQVEQIQKSNEQVLALIEKLRKSLNEENTGVGPKGPGSTSLVTAADNAHTIIEQLQSNYTRITSNPVFNPRCEALTSSIPQMVKSVSDLASNAAPLVMTALSLAPTIGIQTKLIGIAGTMLASMASGIAESIIRQGVNLSKEENRRAVVQNICQFTKVYRKYKLIQLARSSDLNAIQIILNNQIADNEIELEYTNPSLHRILSKRASFEKSIGEVINELTTINSKIVEEEASERFKNDSSAPDQCSYFYDEVFRQDSPQNVNIFSRIEKSVENASNALIETERSQLLSDNQGNVSPATLLRQRFIQQSVRKFQEKKANLEQILSGALTPAESTQQTDVTEDIFKTCAAAGKSIFEETKKLFTETQNILRVANQNLNRQMESDAAAKEWQSKYLSFRSDVQQVQGLWKLIREVREKASPLMSADVSIKIDRVRKNLIGEFNGSTWNPLAGSSVTTAWMNYQMAAYDNALSSFEDFLKILQADGARILAQKTGPHPYRNEPRLKNKYNEQMKLHAHKVPNLEILMDAATVSPAFRVGVCQKLLTAYLEYSKARDFFNSARFMCSMVREELPLAEQQLQAQCQPANILVGAHATAQVTPQSLPQLTNQLTGLNAELVNLSTGSPIYGGLSPIQMVSQVTGLVRHLRCHTVIQIPEVTDRELNNDLGML